MSDFSLRELMGSETSEAEAKAMQEILAERGLHPDEMTDTEFFTLIPDAIDRAGTQAR